MVAVAAGADALGFILYRKSPRYVDPMMIQRIVAQLPPGSAVTHPRHSIQYVVTEYGVADLRGKTLRERAEALTAIAHPNFRESLEKFTHENY